MNKSLIIPKKPVPGVIKHFKTSFTIEHHKLGYKTFKKGVGFFYINLSQEEATKIDWLQMTIMNRYLWVKTGKLVFKRHILIRTSRRASQNNHHKNKAAPFQSTKTVMPQMTDTAYLNQNLIRNIFLL